METDKEFEELLQWVAQRNAKAKPQDKINVNVTNGTAEYAVARVAKTPDRNDPCPCNSGKKYKKCCMGK